MAEILNLQRGLIELRPTWLLLACAFGWALPAAAQTDRQTTARGASEAPLVSGFERFGRHDEISEQLAGALLISELNCVGCHASSDDWLQPKRGPRLGGAGNRLEQDWLRRYLAEPHELKPRTTMPHVLASLPADERSQAARALAAFVATQVEPFAEIRGSGAVPVLHEFWKRGDAESGARLYHSIGCVACHEADPDYETAEAKPSALDEMLEQLDPEELAELGLAGAARRVESVPHGELGDKYSLRSLTTMLLDPAGTRPDTRMPSLRLSPAEAADIAAYLLRENDAPAADLAPAAPPQELVDRGRSLFVELRCSNCHEAQGVDEQRPAPPLAELAADAGSSCIEHPSAGMPHYSLDDPQRAAIRAVLHAKETPERTAGDDVSFRMLQLNCYGCHQRDGLGGVGRYRKPYFETVGHVDLGDEGRLPPPLGGVGRKLRPKALAGVFHPKAPPHRPYMTVRMPTYPADAVMGLLARLPEADDVDASQESKVFPAAHAPPAAGRELANTGCVECHPFRGESLPGVVGIDLAGINQRVHPRWFYEFVLNPLTYRERTRMPTFFPNGKSNRQDLLEGDVPRQLAALWAYLEHLDREPLPEKIETVRAANFELSPEERPIVLRTFMRDAGTHAIAVGFPQGVHYAFDAEQVRPAVAWKGRFLDARGTWFERFAPPADPLGEHHVNFPAGPLFRADSPRDYAFGGYRLDAAGVPTLLYRYGDCSIEDRLEATGDGLKRTIHVRTESPRHDIALRPHAAKKLARSGPSTYTDDQGLSVTVPANLAEAGSVHSVDEAQEWLIPLDVRDNQTLVLEYRW